MFLRAAASALSLLLLTGPLHAEEQAAADTTSTDTAAEATEPVRAPLAERSEMEATALAQQLEPQEQQHLQAGDERFLALWLPANTAESSGVVIILPGDAETADWPQSVGPLRHKLPNAGWHSLSLTLPDPNGDAPPRRSPAPQTQAPSETPAEADPATASNEEANTPVDAPRADTRDNSLDSAETAASKAKSIEEQQQAHADRVLARIESAIGFAEQQQAKTIVLLGHGSGAYWAARYLAERKPGNIHNLLMVAAALPAGYTPPLDELIPQLPLATGDFYYKDLPADRTAALKRSQASKRQKQSGYTQVAMKALPGNREAEQEQLYRRIRGWLTLKLQVK
ncbi:alpha/beta hydrolase family protein [Pseudomonas sp. MIL19]|uniref:alpha/beta hydrolase family protein n=1 Tax=Pseudomonas sp. MIL19 TaxID=2976979 RepID=UPI002364918A|nr:alpha/beta hydrolase family protein [Pseudomonas sp. MIL19]MDD2161963.1 alpha/beta hydrolase family protein [Pseudomonas sp. MIL19]